MVFLKGKIRESEVWEYTWSGGREGRGVPAVHGGQGRILPLVAGPLGATALQNASPGAGRDAAPGPKSIGDMHK